MQRQSPLLASVPLFAELTSQSARAVWRQVARGEIPSFKLGRRRLIPVDTALAALVALGHANRGAGVGEAGGRLSNP